MGDRTRHQPRYSISQLLDPTFIFPRSEEEQEMAAAGTKQPGMSRIYHLGKDDGKAINLNGIVGIQGLNFDEVR